jgi:competence protein ComEA
LLARYRYVLFSVLGLALIGALGYGLTHRPAPLQLTILLPAPTALPTSTPTPAPVRCHVTGAVAAPGVYTLLPAASVNDALQAAGGPSIDADLEGINLAAEVQDQQQVFVPRRLWVPARADGLTVPQLVNINTADEETLETLPGIGPALAGRIIAYREDNGPFIGVDDLVLVKGIGDATLEKLRPWITTGP